MVWRILLTIRDKKKKNRLAHWHRCTLEGLRPQRPPGREESGARRNRWQTYKHKNIDRLDR
jgi:hypothetical protein